MVSFHNVSSAIQRDTLLRVLNKLALTTDVVLPYVRNMLVVAI